MATGPSTPHATNISQACAEWSLRRRSLFAASCSGVRGEAAPADSAASAPLPAPFPLTFGVERKLTTPSPKLVWIAGRIPSDFKGPEAEIHCALEGSSAPATAGSLATNSEARPAPLGRAREVEETTSRALGSRTTSAPFLPSREYDSSAAPVGHSAHSLKSSTLAPTMDPGREGKPKEEYPRPAGTSRAPRKRPASAAEFFPSAETDVEFQRKVPPEGRAVQPS